MLGALRCSPTNALEAEANLMPLDLYRKQDLALYATRVLNIPNHSTRKLLLNYYPYRIYEEQRLPLPSTGRAYKEFIDIGLTFQTVPTTTTIDKLNKHKLSVFHTLANHRKDSLSSAQWIAEYHSLIDMYPAHHYVFTDGSLQGTDCGAAMWYEKSSLMTKLPNGSSIYTAELYAIYMTLTFLKNLNGNFLILSDSLSAIIGLTSPNKNSHYLIFKIAEIMSRNPQKFTIEWIPSHQNINGNEKADTLAKQACSSKTSAWIQPSTKEIKDKISNYYKNKWQVRWRNTNAALYKYSPTIKLHSSLSLKRQEQIALTRLRLNTCIATHGHYFKGNPAPTCESCNTRITINHLLIDCPLYNKQREPVIKECNIKCVPFTMQSIPTE